MTSTLSSMTLQNLAHDRRVQGAAWNQTYGNYFSNPKNLQIFAQKVMPFLPHKKELDILYAAAGTGALGETLVHLLKNKKTKARLWLLDASQKNLNQNKNRKTKKIHGDLLTVRLQKQFDVILMRSSLDYFWNEKSQIRVLHRIRNWLAPSGVFFNQVASMPSKTERDSADQIYRSNSKIGKRHFQCPADIQAIYRKAGFKKTKKIGNAPALILTEHDHVARYGLNQRDIEKIRKKIEKIPSNKRPNIRTTSKGYRIRFVFPVYAAQ